MGTRSEAELATVEQEMPASSAEGAVFVLEVIDGPDLGARFTIQPDSPGPVLIGQAPACAVRLADRQVSRRHASLDPRGGRLLLVDAGSTNGTLVGGLLVERAWLVGGEVIRVGATSLRVERGARTLARPSPSDRFGRLLGASASMRRLHGHCERLAGTLSPVLIEGEQGTGKELCAESLHESGPRRQGPFVVFDCTTQAGGPGPFASATSEPPPMAAAIGGTIFFREISELPPASQERLRAWLEEQRAASPAARLGTALDVRVLASSSRDLDRAAQRDRFSAGLVEILAGNRIVLPPLRERAGDVRLLAERFFAELHDGTSSLTEQELASLEDSPLAGNVRELRFEIARLVGRREGGDRSESIEEVLALDLPFSQARQRALREFQRRYVERVLARHGGNVSRAAHSAGIARRYFQIIKARKSAGDG